MGQKNSKNWKLSPLFSSQILFFLLIASTLYETFEVITTEKKQLVFEVAIRDKEAQVDMLQQNATIVHAYTLQLDSPGWFYSFVIDNNIGWSPLHCITFLIIWSCGLLLTFKLDSNNLFSNDLSLPITIASISLILFFFIERYTHRSFRSTVQEITHSQFKLVHLKNTWMIWVGIGLIWLSKMMRRGYQLQNEQDLTI